MQRFLNDSRVCGAGATLAALWLTALAATASMEQAAPAQKTVADGVYSAAQAARGETIFANGCVSCHSPADFTGDEFLTKWNGKPLFDLFDVVKATMPMDNPGTLKPQEYADVIAYFLKLNKFPAGEEELKGTEEAMKAVSVKKG